MFIHPALDLPLVRLSALLERAEPSVTKVLEDTAFLAHHRIRRDAELRNALTQLDAPPFVGPSRSFYALSEHVTQRDLLIAMLASEKNVYRESLYAGAPPNPDGFGEIVGRAQVQYASMMESKTRHELDATEAFARTLDLQWSARHALDWRSGHDEPLTMDSLVCALEPRAWMALAEYVPDYIEGLVTAEEAAAWLVRPYRERLLPAFESIYVDLHGQLDALHGILRQSPAVWIMGNVGSGRNALAAAWMNSPELPIKGLRHGITWHERGSAPDENAFGPAHGVGLDALVHLLVCPDDGSRTGPARARIGDVTLTGGSGALEKLTPHDFEVLLEAMTLRSDAARALVISSAAERAIVCNAIPDAETIPVLEVPPLTEADHLLVWLSKVPSARLPGGALPPISTMIAGFAAATEAERQIRSIEVIERALSRGRVLMGDGAQRVVEALARVRRGRTLRLLEEQAVERFLGSEARLSALAAFAPRWDALT